MMGGMGGGMGFGGMMPGAKRMALAKGKANGMAMDAAAPMDGGRDGRARKHGPDVEVGRKEAVGRRRRFRRRRERPLGAAHDSQAVRRHGLVGRLADDRQGRHGRGLAQHAREPYHLANQGLGHGQGTNVGEGQTDVVTRKDLIIRMETAAFLRQKDEVVLSAIVHNYLKTEKNVQVALELGEHEKLLDILVGNLTQTAKIAANQEARVDWRVKVLDEGQATIRMKALTDEESDAMEQKFPCYVHGMLKMEAVSGAIRPAGTEGKFTVKVPAERRPKESRLEVRYSPTLAGAMVDALPYLVEYPYGCTEQTLNRFLPTVITQKVLINMGLNLKEIQKKRTNLNAQEIGNDQERAKQWKHYERNPVFDEDEVRRMVKEGVERLTEMQLSDGGWGWFSGWGEHSTPHTTALVIHGLAARPGTTTWRSSRACWKRESAGWRTTRTRRCRSSRTAGPAQGRTLEGVRRQS